MFVMPFIPKYSITSKSNDQNAILVQSIWHFYVLYLNYHLIYGTAARIDYLSRQMFSAGGKYISVYSFPVVVMTYSLKLRRSSLHS